MDATEHTPSVGGPMSIRKFGTGEPIHTTEGQFPQSNVHVVASRNWTEDDQDALDTENRRTDGDEDDADGLPPTA